VPTLRHEPFPRPQDLSDRSDPAVLYVRSYLLTRTVVGVLGVLLPVALVAGEAFGVPGPVQVRDSLSAYYHTPMHDVFVGGLSVMAFLLATYLAGQPRTWDFLLSLTAGVALLVVVAVARFGFTYLRRYRGGRVGLEVQYDLRNAMHDHLQTMDLDNLDRMPTGQLVARASSDSMLVQGLLNYMPTRTSRKACPGCANPRLSPTRTRRTNDSTGSVMTISRPASPRSGSLPRISRSCSSSPPGRTR